MIQFKSVKWSLGIALTLGLAACNWDMQRSEHRESRYEQIKEAKHAPAKAKAEQKRYASKDPTRQATPGPVRKAAPQLPVIQ